MFIRFVHSQPVEGMKHRAGFFVPAYVLMQASDVSAETRYELSRILDWFANNLPHPEKFNTSKSKGAWRRNTRGLSWFRPEAREMLDKAFELVCILEMNDIAIDRLQTDRVGYVNYEDAFQIVAEPFADTPG